MVIIPMIVGVCVLAANRVTATIPIVFVSGDDPVKRGLIASLNRPGGNTTGVYQFSYLLEAKRLALLHDMLPKVATIAALIDPSNPAAETQIHDVQKAAGQLGVHLVVLTANVESDFVTAIRKPRPTAGWGALGYGGSILQQPASTTYRFLQLGMRCRQSMSGVSSRTLAA